MKKQPKFVPKPGQVDYTNIRWAPVINCIVRHKNKILLLKRSDFMRLYPGCWNGTSGFLDDKKSLEQKIKEEMREELGMNAKHILAYKLGAIFDQDEPQYKKTWIVHPVLVDVDTDKIRLDWESKEYRWVSLKEAKTMNLLPGLDQVMKNLFPKF